MRGGPHTRKKSSMLLSGCGGGKSAVCPIGVFDEETGKTGESGTGCFKNKVAGKVGQGPERMMILSHGARGTKNLRVGGYRNNDERENNGKLKRYRV